MDARMKPLVWLTEEVSAPPFSTEARLEAAELLFRLQRGEKLGMPASRPMASIGGGCHELRIRDRSVGWRVFYAIALDAIVILHVTKKKGQQTSQRDIEMCRQRLKQYRAVR